MTLLALYALVSIEDALDPVHADGTACIGTVLLGVPRKGLVRPLPLDSRPAPQHRSPGLAPCSHPVSR